MDLYTLSFFFSTMWVGPFWFGMLVYPEHELTQKAMQGPWFFLGPILMWWVVTLADPQGLIELTKDSTDPTTILDGLATLLGTPAGAAAAPLDRTHCTAETSSRNSLGTLLVSVSGWT